MTAQPDPRQFDLDSFLAQQEQKSLLRIVACGSVDHGKSTLIGRLLYESGTLLDDQVDALRSASRKHGSASSEIDYALLLDGLAAEREQKITIDVAYRFFATERRKFIIADAPGHEQYTRNMATGASTADVALILVNAAAGLTAQTKRHSLIVAMLGVRQVIVAINKMDLVGWSESAFRKIEADYRAFARDLDLRDITCIPAAARSGDNVVTRSPAMPWYRGPTLLEHLERIDVGAPSDGFGFRLPVQWVNRPDADFRGYSGTVASGSIRPGMPVRLLPSGQTTTVASIVTFDGALDSASAGQSVTLTLADEVDASRGDVIAAADADVLVTDRLAARIVWMGKETFAPGRTYLLKLGTASATARVAAPLAVIDLDTGRARQTDCLVCNEIGTCTLQLDRAIAVDDYRSSKTTGSFILIDPESYDTIGMGFVEPASAPGTGADVSTRQAAPRRRWLHPVPSGSYATDSHVRSIAKALTWRGTGSLDTFLITWLITGSSALAGGVAATELVTKVVLYYAHERVWSWIPWGRRPLAR